MFEFLERWLLVLRFGLFYLCCWILFCWNNIVRTHKDICEFSKRSCPDVERCDICLNKYAQTLRAVTMACQNRIQLGLFCWTMTDLSSICITFLPNIQHSYNKNTKHNSQIQKPNNPTINNSNTSTHTKINKHQTIQTTQIQKPNNTQI